MFCIKWQMNNIKIKIFLILIARIVLFTGWHTVIRTACLLFLYSHHLPAWYCIGIVRRNSILVYHGAWKVDIVPKTLQICVGFWHISKFGNFTLFLCKKAKIAVYNFFSWLFFIKLWIKTFYGLVIHFENFRSFLSLVM